MSLLLFYNPSPVINQQELSPVVMQEILTVVPTMYSVESSEGQFTESTIEYSSSTNEYNDGLYGGTDRLLGQPPVLFSIDTIKAKLYKLGKI